MLQEKRRRWRTTIDLNATLNDFARRQLCGIAAGERRQSRLSVGGGSGVDARLCLKAQAPADYDVAARLDEDVGFVLNVEKVYNTRLIEAKSAASDSATVGTANTTACRSDGVVALCERERRVSINTKQTHKVNSLTETTCGMPLPCCDEPNEPSSKVDANLSRKRANTPFGGGACCGVSSSSSSSLLLLLLLSRFESSGAEKEELAIAAAVNNETRAMKSKPLLSREG